MRRDITTIAILLLSGSASAADLPPELDQVVQQAETESLPADVLASKAHEGLAKGIPVARVHQVLQSQLRDLRHASALMESGNPDLITATARAVRAGATDAAVMRVQKSQSEIRVRAMTSLGDLLALGFVESDAVRLVHAATSALQPDLAVSQLAPAAAALVTRGGSTDGVTQDLTLTMANNRAPLSALPSDIITGEEKGGKAYGHLKDAPGKSGEHRKK